MQALTALEWLEEEMLSKQEAVLAEARAEFAKEKDALQNQVEKLTQDTLKLAGIRDENELLVRQFGEQREHILQLIRDDEFKESLFEMLRDVWIYFVFIFRLELVLYIICEAPK